MGLLFAAAALLAQDADLAAMVRKGEGWGTTAVTQKEVMQCWATWMALRTHIEQNGRGTFPADYTLANLDRRIADWNAAVRVVYAEHLNEVIPAARVALAKQDAALKGPEIASVAEWSGACKTLPGGRTSQVAATPAPAPAGGETPAIWRARAKAYASGEGAAKNPQQAVYWMRKAAEAGDPGAQNDLAGYYYQGSNGLREDPAEFIRWTRLAANAGHPVAQYNLGLSYYQGSNGVPKNLPESVRWFRLAAEQGDPDAQTDYGASLWWGDGVAVNYPEAVRWFRKAAAQGHAEGQFWLGNAYRRGLGVEFDIRLARFWLGKSAAQGDDEAKSMLRFMDAVDREFAQRVPPAQRETRDGNSLWKQYAETMERQRRENCAAAAQGRNRVCTPY